MNQGIESFFTCVISTKKMSLEKLNVLLKNAKFEDDVKKNKNKLYTLSEEEKAQGFKYVFQTRLTKETVNERIRSPMNMWDMKETFIDNNLQNVINRLHEYYK